MTERQFQAKLLKALRAHPALKDAVIFKHSDRINGGIPDVSITKNGNTTWLELKVHPNKLSALQSYYLQKLGSRAYVVIYHNQHQSVTLHSKDLELSPLGSLQQTAHEIAIRVMVV